MALFSSVGTEGGRLEIGEGGYTKEKRKGKRQEKGRGGISIIETDDT